MLLVLLRNVGGVNGLNLRLRNCENRHLLVTKACYSWLCVTGQSFPGQVPTKNKKNLNESVAQRGIIEKVIRLDFIDRLK